MTDRTTESQEMIPLIVRMPRGMHRRLRNLARLNADLGNPEQTQSALVRRAIDEYARRIEREWQSKAEKEGETLQ